MTWNQVIKIHELDQLIYANLYQLQSRELSFPWRKTQEPFLRSENLTTNWISVLLNEKERNIAVPNPGTCTSPMPLSVSSTISRCSCHRDTVRGIRVRRKRTLESRRQKLKISEGWHTYHFVIILNILRAQIVFPICIKWLRLFMALQLMWPS